MAFTTTTATNVLKNRYLGPIREQLENSSVLWSEINKETTIKVSGKNWTVPLHNRRNLSAGTGVVEMGTLQTPSEQGYTTLVVPRALQYGRGEISGPTFSAMRDDAGAFIRALASETEGLARDMIKSFNREFHSDGTDALAYTVGADDTTPINVSDGQLNPFIFAKVGDNLDVLDASSFPTITLLNTGALVVSSLTPAATNVALAWTGGTLSGTAAGDVLVKTGTGGQQLMGIRGLISNVDPPLLSGGLEGIPVAGNAFWTSQVFSNAGVVRPLTSLLMRKVMSAVAMNSDYKDKDIKFVLTSYEGADEYYNVCNTEKRQVNTLKLDSGFEGLNFCGVPVIADPDCRKNTMYFIVPESMAIFEQAPLDFMEKDGSVLHRRESQDSYFFTMYFYGQLMTYARNANGLLGDIQISVA